MRAKPFFKTRFRIKPGKGQNHWIGGTWEGKGAICPVCREPLLLVMSFDCASPELKKASQGKLESLSRLPLLTCMRCMSELSYQVDESGVVTILFTRYANGHDNRSYQPYPEEFDRKAVVLDDEIPSEVSRALKRWLRVDPIEEEMSAEDRETLESFFGHGLFIHRCLTHHQLGGRPLAEAWEDNGLQCRNPKCSGGFFDRLMKRPRPMRFLAGVLNDPPGGLPLVEPLNEETTKDWLYGVSHYWQICDKCLSITTFSTSD
ncbi:MAG: hypothetical protein U0744_15315 [Gemmataceae bacterium]